MRVISKYLESIGWDKRITAVSMYTLLPAFVGTLTRLAGINPMLGDFFGLDLDDGIVKTFCALVIYVWVAIVLFLLLAKIGSRTEFKIAPKREVALGVCVLLHQVSSMVFTLQSGFGVAASSDSVDSNLKIVFILLSSDYIFCIYFLIARNRPGLVALNAVVYLVYSVLRGWASGILVLLVLGYIKHPEKVKWRSVLIWLGALFMLAPLLLGVREFFRGSEESSDIWSILATVLENLHYDDVVFVLVNRFDLVPPTQTFATYFDSLRPGLDAGNVCYVWNEGIYQTIFFALTNHAKCVAAGEVLPSLIHGSFFFDRRTAFSVGAGWLYGADFLSAICFAMYVAALLLWSRLLAGPLVRIPAIRAFFAFLIVCYLVPGWYFHFIQAINAVFFANLFLRLRGRRSSGAARISADQKSCVY